MFLDPRKSISWKPRDLLHPIHVRPRTSDPEVCVQVLLEREYAPIVGLEGVESVIDLGANAGYSSAFFLSHYPAARCLAVEPDPENFAVLRTNMSPYGDRVLCVHGGAWNRCCHLSLSDARYRDGKAWSRQVCEVAADQPGALPGFDVPSMLKLMGFRRVSILKVDIEGAEAVVFDDSCHSWIDAIDHIAIELHDDSLFGPASPIFWRAVSDRGFRFSRSGELVIASRPAR